MLQTAFGSFRFCLVSPLPEFKIAADLLSEAADAVVAGDVPAAQRLARTANMQALFEHSSLVMGGRHPRFPRRRPVHPWPLGSAKARSRMPPDSVVRAVFTRDGWRCRYCQCRVVPPKMRSALKAAVSTALPWGEAEGFHGAFYAISASLDHVVPHSGGGTNDEENLVTSCWPCQFGRGYWSLDELGLIDPRRRAPIRDAWDGLTRLARVSGRSVAARRDWTVDEWFASLDGGGAPVSGRLMKLIESCAHLGVSWALNDWLLIRMGSGSAVLNVIGVERTGRVEVPWSIDDKKTSFRNFAFQLAAAIPDAEAYETPKTWTVSRARKQRLHVRDLVAAADDVRSALATLRFDLGAIGGEAGRM